MTQSFTILDNAYLFIITGKDKESYTDKLSATTKRNAQIGQNGAQQQLNKNTVGEIAGKVGMAIYTSPIFQNLASKAIPTPILSRINSGLYSIMSDGKISSQEVMDTFLTNTVNILDNVATDLGFPTPTSLYRAISPDGEGLSFENVEKFIKSFSKNAKKEIDKKNEDKEKKIKENQDVIKFKLVTKDSESWRTDTPERRTESGMSLIPVLGNQNLEKSFTCTVVDEPDILMYAIKDKLYQLRDSREAFDVIVLDTDVTYSYRLNHCVFTDITIDTNNKNALDIELSIIKIPEYNIERKKIEPLIQNYRGVKSQQSSKVNTKNNKSGISKTQTDKQQQVIKDYLSVQTTRQRDADMLNKLRAEFWDYDSKAERAKTDSEKNKYIAKSRQKRMEFFNYLCHIDENGDYTYDQTLWTLDRSDKMLKTPGWKAEVKPKTWGRR